MRKKDQSTEFIKTCLADALLKLMRQGDSFDEINVKDICNQAGIGRTTYYRHFDNKSGKDNLILFKVFTNWKNYCVDKTEALNKSRMQVLIDFFYSEKELFMLLHQNGLTMTAIFNVLYLAIGPAKDEPKETAYWRSFLACSIFGFIYNWLQRGFEDSPEYIYSLISKVYPN